MQHKKLAGYFFLSLFSFSFFTIVLHASAQTPDTPLGQIIAVTEQPPTPTLYETQVTPDPTVAPTIATYPTPTIYIAPQKEEPKVLGSKVFNTAEIASPTPQPTAVPEPTVEPTNIPQPVLNAGELEPLFDKYSGEFGVDKEDLKGIAKCESGFNSQADSGLYVGMFQFAESTWVSNRNAMGLDPNPELRKNAEESIRTAAWKIKSGGRNAWPNC